ncbi:YraN family protein [Clostridium sp.]|uniref:YraN family protein n=1 Tax=Clostridium sp. TaxID=1506 RepID=UPI002FC85F6B
MGVLNKSIGSHGEDIAETYLKEMGYTILERNFKCKIGEIDLIAKDDKYICFVEVKSRYGSLYGSPGESVTKLKQYKIYRTAQSYILKKKLYKFNFRFDVIEIILNNKDDNYSIKLIKDAFQI